MSWVQWCMPLTPAFREAETGGSLWAGARSTKWDQKSQGSTAKVVSKKKKKKGKKERREKMIRFFLAPSLTHSFQSVRNSYQVSFRTVLVLSSEIPILSPWSTVISTTFIFCLFCFLRQGCMQPTNASNPTSQVLGSQGELLHPGFLSIFYHSKHCFFYTILPDSKGYLSWNSLLSPD